jgi:hypothetical protein
MDFLKFLKNKINKHMSKIFAVLWMFILFMVVVIVTQ